MRNSRFRDLGFQSWPSVLSYTSHGFGSNKDHDQLRRVIRGTRHVAPVERKRAATLLYLFREQKMVEVLKPLWDPETRCRRKHVAQRDWYIAWKGCRSRVWSSSYFFLRCLFLFLVVVVVLVVVVAGSSFSSPLTLVPREFPLFWLGLFGRAWISSIDFIDHFFLQTVIFFHILWIHIDPRLSISPFESRTGIGNNCLLSFGARSFPRLLREILYFGFCFPPPRRLFLGFLSFVD